MYLQKGVHTMTWQGEYHSTLIALEGTAQLIGFEDVVCAGLGIAPNRRDNAALQSNFFPITSSVSDEKYSSVSDVLIAMATLPNTQGYVDLGRTNFYTMQAIQ
jgi:hypothetical protein